VIAVVEWNVDWEPGLVSGCSLSVVVDLHLLSAAVAAFVELWGPWMEVCFPSLVWVEHHRIFPVVPELNYILWLP